MNHRASLTLALAVSAACIGAAACGNAAGPREEILQLLVAPDSITCWGIVGEQKCLQVRQSPTEPWGRFYDAIEGFDHEPGVLYELRVARRRIIDPPADGSSFHYRLLSVINKTVPPA